MATEDEKTEEVDDVTLSADDFVYDTKTNKYVRKSVSPELYRQQNLAAQRRGLLAGGLGVAGEFGQFLVGTQALQDPAVKESRRDKAQLRAEMAKGPDLLTDEEKSARREAAMAPVQRRAEALQRRTEKIAASTGQIGARGFLEAGQASVDQARQAALDIEARLAAEDVAREKIKKQEDAQRQARIDSINAMLFNLNNENIRRPVQRMIKSAADVAGKALAYAPAKSIDTQIENLERLGVPPDDIAEVNRLLATEPKKGRKKLKELTEKYKGEPPKTEKKKEAASEDKKPVEVDVGFKKADEFWKGKKRGDGDDFRRWARANYPEDVIIKDDKIATLDASGNVTSGAFKDAWNKYGEEYLKDKQSRPPGRVPSVAEMEAARAESERDVGFGFKRSVGAVGSYDTGDGFTVIWNPAMQEFKIVNTDTREQVDKVPVKELKESDEEFLVNMRKMAEQEGLL